MAVGLGLALAACGRPAGPAAGGAVTAPPPGPARRPCPAAAAVDPPSCVRAAVRGRLLKDDPDAHLRIYQACDGGFVTTGSYVAERVGRARPTADQVRALLDAHRREVVALAPIQTSYGACGPGANAGADADAGCIEVGFQEANEDVPSVAADLVRIFATSDDVCVGFRIDTGVATGE